MKNRIESAIDGAVAYVNTDGHHFKAVVVAEAFRSVPPIKRHRMVYGALREELKEQVHALTLRTLTPEDWEAQPRPR